MSDISWFLLIDSQVVGPYSQHQIEGLITQHPYALVWAKGLSEWVDVKAWQNKIKKITTPVQTEKPWRMKYKEVKVELSFDDLITQLKSLPDLESVDVYDNAKQIWKSVFYYSEVTDALGVSRRLHPRVPLVGELHCSWTQWPFKVVTISQGGFGLVSEDGSRFVPGFKDWFVLKSINLPIELNFEAEVLYRSKDGYVGLKFTKLSSETTTELLNYIKQFDF